MITWVVFDLGGVVIEVEFDRFFRALPEGVQGAAKDQGHRIIEVFRIYEESSGRHPPESVFDGIRALLGSPLTNQQITDAVNAVLGRQKQDVCDIIEGLQRKVQLACLSNTNHIHWEVLLSDYPVMNIFSLKMASHLLGCSKPASRIYQNAAKMLGAPPAELLFFDDKLENVEAAKKCGWNACVFEDIVRFEQDLREFGVLSD